MPVPLSSVVLFSSCVELALFEYTLSAFLYELPFIVPFRGNKSMVALMMFGLCGRKRFMHISLLCVSCPGFMWLPAKNTYSDHTSYSFLWYYHSRLLMSLRFLVYGPRSYLVSRTSRWLCWSKKVFWPGHPGTIQAFVWVTCAYQCVYSAW